MTFEEVFGMMGSWFDKIVMFPWYVNAIIILVGIWAYLKYFYPRILDCLVS